MWAQESCRALQEVREAKGALAHDLALRRRGRNHQLLGRHGGVGAAGSGGLLRLGLAGVPHRPALAVSPLFTRLARAAREKAPKPER